MAKEMNYEALQATLRMLDKKSEFALEQARANGALTPEQEKFSALMTDEAFLEKFLAADSAEDVQVLFKENGLEFSQEEINAFGKYLVGISKKIIENGGELSEEELEQIAGGSFIDFMDNRSDDEQLGGALGAVTGIGAGVFGMGFGGAKLGAAIGTCICPGPGSAAGAVTGLTLGMISGTVIGFFGGATGGIGIVKGVKKVGGWIKSCF